MGGVFTQAVSGGKLGNDSLFLQHARNGGAHRQDGRLSIFSELKLLFRPFKAKLRDGESQSIVSFLKRMPRHRIERCQLFSHSCCL